jgi:hypothetical protein
MPILSFKNHPLLAVRIACPLFVYFLLRPAPPVPAGPRNCPVLIGLFIIKPGLLFRGICGLCLFGPRRVLPVDMVVPLAVPVPWHLFPNRFLLDILRIVCHNFLER